MTGAKPCTESIKIQVMPRFQQSEIYPSGRSPDIIRLTHNPT